MLIAISVNENNPQAPIEPRFGRTQGFIVYNTDTKQSEYLSNESNAQAPQGAGIQTTQLLADNKISIVITGKVGPKAQEALVKGGIQIIETQAQTVAEAIANTQNQTDTTPPSGNNLGCRRLGGTGMAGSGTGRGQGGGNRKGQGRQMGNAKGRGMGQRMGQSGCRGRSIG